MTQNAMRQYDDRMAGGGVMHQQPGEVPPGMAGDQAKALAVLTMAQRTAEEHINTAIAEAEQIRADAHANAQQIISDAQSQAGALRDEAEKILSRARAAAEKIAREAEAYAGETERNAGEVLADAQARAEDIVREAEDNAYNIKQRAEQIYEDVVGGLTSKRQALQQQIEALERFDQEYRSRLTSFMQQQMRALWVGRPQVNEAQEYDGAAVAGELLPAQRTAHEDEHDPQPAE
jgi:cell division septum initiation protein DivIVA